MRLSPEQEAQLREGAQLASEVDRIVSNALSDFAECYPDTHDAPIEFGLGRVLAKLEAAAPGTIDRTMSAAKLVYRAVIKPRMQG